jgi:hypothetical protein
MNFSNYIPLSMPRRCDCRANARTAFLNMVLRLDRYEGNLFIEFYIGHWCGRSTLISTEEKSLEIFSLNWMASTIQSMLL